jgi:pyruvate, orthophosphate dikinase
LLPDLIVRSARTHCIGGGAERDAVNPQPAWDVSLIAPHAPVGDRSITSLLEGAIAMTILDPRRATAPALVIPFDDAGGRGRDLLGGKGAGLAEMAALGVPVPAGFTITTEACRAYLAHGHELPPELEDELAAALGRLEEQTGLLLGDSTAPLLVSVRSGAAISMPGMMDSILDLGLNDDTVAGLAWSTGNPRFAYDSYRRLIQMYGEVVEGIEAASFEHELDLLKAERGASFDLELTTDDLAELIQRYMHVYESATGHGFVQDAHTQLLSAVRSVFESWNSPRAVVYRKTYGIADDLGTAVNVMQMVFGNKGESCGTGVCFSRDPSTGEKGLCGEFLANAQGEDVVAGIRHPEPLDFMRTRFPAAYSELAHIVDELERHYRDVQDVEFTLDDGTLYLLQTRSAKRTAAAAVKTAVAMVDEGLLTRDDALVRIEPAQLDHLLHPTLDPSAELDVLATGLAASPGAASGHVVLDADTAAARGAAGDDVILVRWETSPDDIHGLVAAKGILTAHGGIASHAALVARGLGKPCVAGCETLTIDLDARVATIGGRTVAEDAVITLDGATGRVALGEVALVPARLSAELETLLGWADEAKRLEVHANADTPGDARKARELGAQGIGLCRTEHMFFGAERLPVVQEMILAEDEGARRAALDRLLPFQQSDFEAIFEAMAGLPVTIRLLDPPLHEFLPALDEATDERMRARILALHEANPMLGTRGCRLGLEWPEIYEMQVRAIARAAMAVDRRTGLAPRVEIMHPLVAFGEELERLRALTVRVAREEGFDQPYRIGTMIELPRACMCAGEIAANADFFSFGTNDLTQTALGFSRDDAEGKFLTRYLEDGVLAHDPFVTLDRDGVGALMAVAVERGRAVKPELPIGICGEHGGDPDSVRFCHELGLDYVSCSPYRVPVARLAAAQAALAERGAAAYAAAGG